MKAQSRLAGGLLLTTALLVSHVSAFAQQQRTAVDQKAATERALVLSQKLMQGPGDPGLPPLPDDTIVFVASEMNFDGKLVKGAPYSAEAVTENVQVLADGNRIVHKSSAMIYRDTEGRTRREHTLTNLGGFSTGDEAAHTISINDPVAGVNYALDPRSKTAHKMMPMQFKFKIAEPPADLERQPAPAPDVIAPEAAVRGEIRIERSQTPPPAGVERVDVEPQVFMRHVPGPDTAAAGGIVMQWHGGASKDAKTEQLGKQTIEGVEAEGRRTTITIPAGQIGNERAIEMVSETWYSPELQVVVMTKHSDPRMGETSYRLTNINRSEQPKSLFEVPADYTIKDSSMVGPQIHTMKMRKPAPDQE